MSTPSVLAEPEVAARSDAPAGAAAGVRSARVQAVANLVFVPDAAAPHWFLWGSEAAQSPLAVLAEPDERWLPEGSAQGFRLRRMRGYRLPLLQGVMQLACLTQGQLKQLPTAQVVWSLATKLGLELIARQQVVPRVGKWSGQQAARWQMALTLSEDRQRLAQLWRAFPICAHALPLDPPTLAERQTNDVAVWTASGLLHQFLDTLADQVIRAAGARPPKRKLAAPAADSPWPLRWLHALSSAEAEFMPAGLEERAVLADLREWLQPVTQQVSPALQLVLQLLPPTVAHEEFVLEFRLKRHDQDDAGVSATDLFAEPQAAEPLKVEPRQAQEQLLRYLAVAARAMPLIDSALRTANPEQLSLKPRVVCEFLGQVPALQQSGIAVLLPDDLKPAQQQRVRMIMRLGAELTPATGRLEPVPYLWQVRLAGQSLSAADIDALLALRTPLTRFANAWVLLDSRELLHAQQLLLQRGGQLPRATALSLALLGSQTQPDTGLTLLIEPVGELAELVQQMHQQEAIRALPDPPGLQAQLRPYQRRGFSWLTHLTELGLGACLADDMGLGKTVQLIATLLQLRASGEARPILLVCPTSVIGNWERELARFAPTLGVLRHYGPERVQNAPDFSAAAQQRVVLTSFGLLRRDIDWLAEVPFALCALDEAQFIKNSGAATARAARKIQAQRRVALTGTPVENQLTELWSVMEFLNPGLLGPREAFRRDIALPVERHGREDLAEKLRQMVAPFILRRLKTDPKVITDLPAKQEHKMFCSLTREQASLYSQAVNEAMLEIEGVDGMTRRGRVLALLTALKQVCNHPAHYLREQGPLSGRSGKFDRLLEMLEHVLSNGDRALVFTQYREMGERLSRALGRLHGKNVPFLHGGVTRQAREEMVRRFQEDPRAARLLVISLKAGGTGLNLTAATQVFHFDRWWNPAVEDQATDRAYRIGQQKNVQVYKLLCAGTIEDKIDQMLEAKRDLADRIVRQGEAWISELDNTQLRELFALAPNAVVGDLPEEELPASQAASRSPS